MLPVILDVGTDNKDLLVDPSYVGTQQPRLQGEEYFDMIDEFMVAAFSRWPGVVVQFEDFETSKAVPLLAKYKDKYRCFNDDIQGTGCVTLSGLMSAARNAGTKITDMKIMCVGAGSAGLGVCALLLDGMVEAGLTVEEVSDAFYSHVCISSVYLIYYLPFLHFLIIHSITSFLSRASIQSSALYFQIQLLFSNFGCDS